MAYTIKYSAEWMNVNGQICTFEIYDSEFTGDTPIEVKPSDNPVNIEISAGDDTPLDQLIFGSSASFEYINEGQAPLSDFFTEDDRRFRAKFMLDSNVKFVGFLVPNDCAEDFWALPHKCRLTFTDNISSLEAMPLNEVIPLNQWRTDVLIGYPIRDLGLEIPINVYNNVFEINMDDRVADVLNSPFNQTYINPFSFKNDDGTYKNSLVVIKEWLLANDSILYQADGNWNIVRLPEFARFANQPPGTKFTITDLSIGLSTVDPFTTLIAQDDLIPIEFNQVTSLRKGFKSVTRTFNFNQPPLIANQNLQDLGTHRGDTVSGSETWKEYDFPSNTFIEQGGQDAWIRVVFETATGRETDRYMVMDYHAIGGGDNPTLPSAAVRTQKIPVTHESIIDFQCEYRSESNGSNNSFFGVAFFLRQCSSSTQKYLNRTNNTDASTNKAIWATYVTAVSDVPPMGYSDLRGPSIDKTQWKTYNAKVIFDPNSFGIPPTPFDGTLEVAFYGLNKWNNQQVLITDTYIKGINLTVKGSVTDSSQIKAQTHISELNDTILNTQAEEVFIDDSPFVQFAGAMFLDNNTCPTLTKQWKPQSGTPTTTYRFGQINTIDRLLLNQRTRQRIEGDFKWTTAIPSFKSLIQFNYAGIPDKTFLITRLSMNYMTCVISGTFDEIWDTSDADIDDPNYEFKTIYKEL